jgi:hypothetical protein
MNRLTPEQRAAVERMIRVAATDDQKHAVEVDGWTCGARQDADYDGTKFVPNGRVNWFVYKGARSMSGEAG